MYGGMPVGEMEKMEKMRGIRACRFGLLADHPVA